MSYYTAYKKKDKVPVKTVSTQEALAMACAAQRINGAYLKDTRRFSCEENKTQFANKDYAQVAEIQKWMKRYIMLGLGELDDFKKDMIGAVSADVVPNNNLGRVAFIPEFVKRDQRETGLTKEIRVEYRDSAYLGKEKDMVDGVAKILDKRFSSQWESFNYTAVMDGNLVSFMNKHDHEVGAMKRIKGKVKAQTKNKLFSANETRLNYVKLYKV